MNKNSSITIIGGGIVGCSIAYELSKGYRNITVLERNNAIPGLNQSSTNEGSIHSGIYYPKEIMPLKAKLCVLGNKLLYEFLQKYNLPFKKNGKLIIATNSEEEEYLDFFQKVGIGNGVLGIKKITGKKAMNVEPNLANVTSALLIPSSGFASPDALITKIKSLAKANGVLFSVGTRVLNITQDGNKFTITTLLRTRKDTVTTDLIINSAGLFADEIARMINPKFSYEIDPVRGEFFNFDRSKRKNLWLGGMHIYQPPYCYKIQGGKMKVVNVNAAKLSEFLKEGKVFITAGIHLSPVFEKAGGRYIFGNKIAISPIKTVGLGKEDYTSKLHNANGFIQKIHYFFPNVKKEDIQFDHSGIMAPLKGFRDFVIEKDKANPNFINLVGMESPAWTSCLAIGKYVTELVGDNNLS